MRKHFLTAPGDTNSSSFHASANRINQWEIGASAGTWGYGILVPFSVPHDPWNTARYRPGVSTLQRPISLDHQFSEGTLTRAVFWFRVQLCGSEYLGVNERGQERGDQPGVTRRDPLRHWWSTLLIRSLSLSPHLLTRLWCVSPMTPQFHASHAVPFLQLHH